MGSHILLVGSLEKVRFGRFCDETIKQLQQQKEFLNLLGQFSENEFKKAVNAVNVNTNSIAAIVCVEQAFPHSENNGKHYAWLVDILPSETLKNMNYFCRYAGEERSFEVKVWTFKEELKPIFESISDEHRFDRYIKQNTQDAMCYISNQDLRSVTNQPKVNKKTILVVGSGSNDAITLLMNSVFGVEKRGVAKEWTENAHFKFLDHSMFHKLEFSLNEFIETVAKEKSNLAAIICIENLNPRPERIGEDVRILKQAFSTAELKEKLYFFFTFTSNPKSLTSVRADFAEGFRRIFETLNCDDIDKFVNERLWILDQHHVAELKTIEFKSTGMLECTWYIVKNILFQ